MKKAVPFDVQTTRLSGSNLIEASAGTGKTYSVAILVLRLIVEQQVPIEKILMVTFTKAATAELESRIRSFVREGYDCCRNGHSENEHIRQVIQRNGKEASRPYLHKAVQNLDQLSVMTIHSFCEQSLMQFPFETGQPFRFEIATDISGISDLAVNDYWRRRINTLDPELYKHFTGSLTRDAIRRVTGKALEGKEYTCREIENEEEVIERIREMITETSEAGEDFNRHIRENFQEIKTREMGKNPRKFVDDNSGSPARFTSAFISKYTSSKRPQYLEEVFPAECRLYEAVIQARERLKEGSEPYIYHSFKLAIGELTEKITRFKEARSVIDFNDQIRLLHDAVGKGMVNSALASRYDAVFIDEFQDTDKLQYEIFHTLFPGKVLFYIGDPKQSIYGWRKADIDTYKDARDKVDARYHMNLNFRSTPGLLNELNRIFSIEDPFHDKEIGYRRVESGAAGLGEMSTAGQQFNPLEIKKFTSKSNIRRFVTEEITRLIRRPENTISGEPVKASDIAVLVRKNSEGAEIKAALSEADVPAVTVDDTMVMASEEARIVRYLMGAVLHPTRESINRVILHPCFGISTGLIREMDDTLHLENFLELGMIWKESGIYQSLARFFEFYQLRRFGIQQGMKGQRTITNLYHIAEILHRVELENRYAPGELLVWCHRAQQTRSDEYEQRIESQEDAVRIMTVHKSKGLTFRIVFAPYLDLKVDPHELYDFREDGTYKFTHDPSEEQMELWREQNEQENRRLIYVALTRARYKVYLCVNTFRSFADSSLKQFVHVDTIPAWEPVNREGGPEDEDGNRQGEGPEHENGNRQEPGPEADNGGREPGAEDENGGREPGAEDGQGGIQTFTPRPVPDLEIKQRFGIHSFSALSRAHHTAPFLEEELGDPGNYDQFIFQELSRGANAGTALHSIFEHLDFHDPSTWDQSLLDASRFYPNIVEEERLGMFRQLLDHVVHSRIEVSGTPVRLERIGPGEKLPEMEFFFSIDQINKTRVNELLGDEAILSGEADLEGLMTGFIDLVFRQEGRYFILDWKSNYLGNSVEDYDRRGVEEAMTGSNYHLQYLIYSVALKRWLESRIGDFDYERQFGGVIYLFLRGARRDRATGIFTARPGLAELDLLDKTL